MRLLFDARLLQPHFPGIGRYAASLLIALAEVAPHVQLHLLCEAQSEVLDLPNAQWHRVAPIFSAAGQGQAARLARRLNVDLCHAPYYVYPLAWPRPIVVTIHDLIPLEYTAMVPRGWRRWLYGPLHRLAVARADAIITDSDAARHAVIRHLKVAERDVTTVPLAPSPFFAADGTVPRERYFFSLISNKPHKNGGRLIEAYAATDPAIHGVPLLIAGSKDDDWPTVAAMAAAAGVSEWVRYLGFVSDAALRDHYRRCLAFLFLPFAEGFGLPPLEAMACGAPTLIADRAPMNELAGEAALRTDPFDVAGIGSALRPLIEDAALRRALSEQGQARAATFTWQETARQTLRVYEALIREALKR